MHPDRERIERLLHGELDPAEEAGLRDHLSSCSYCAGRLADAEREEREIFALLHRLDHPLPSTTASEVAARATPPRTSLPRIAAGFALLMATSGALYALPGSPLPSLVERAREWLAPGAPDRPAVALPYASGVAVAPGDDLLIEFASGQPRGTLTVRVADAAELSARALGEPVAFDVDIRRLGVRNRGARASYEILVPRAAPAVTIRIGPRLVFRKTGERIWSAVSADGVGDYHLPLSAPGER